MSSPIGMYGGYQRESTEARALGSINQTSYDYRDQGKTTAKLINDVSYMAGYMRKMQKGIDDANQNVLQQIQSLINDFIVILGGGGDTGLDFGDLKYLLQAIGALFGLQPGMPLPINLFSAAWHFFSEYILPVGNFEEAINMIVDGIIASALDIFGEVPIVGQALQQLAQVIAAIRDMLLPVFDALNALLSAFDFEIGDLDDILDFFGPLKPIFQAFMDALDGIDLPNFVPVFTMIANWTQPFVNIIVGLIGAIAAFIRLITGQGSLEDFTDSFQAITSAIDPVGAPDGLSLVDFGLQILETFLNPTGFLDGIIGDFLGPDSPLNALNLFNLSGILGKIGIGNLTNEEIELLDNPGFREAISIEGGGIWTWDNSKGKSVPGTAKVTANGSLRQLISNQVAVAEGDKIRPSVWAQWASLAYSGNNPIKFQVVRFLYSSITESYAVMGTDNIAPLATPGANQSTWLEFAGDYTVPANCSHIALQLVVDINALSGNVWFDDASVKKTGKLQMGWIDGLLDALGGLGDLIENLIDTILGAFSGDGFIGGMLADVFEVLSHIPFLNILGIGGPSDIGGSIQATWDQWVSGLVGAIGTGAGLPDLFNLGQVISGNAAKGGMSFDILGIRNNKPLKTGFLPTSISNINLDKVAIGSTTATTVPITPTTALMSYHIIEEAMPIGAIQWQGFGTTNITDFRVNIYTMNPTTGICDVLLHNSADIKGLLTGGSGPPFPVTYALPSATAVLEPGTIVGVEQVVRGSGAQHNVVGGPTWLQDQVVYPRRWSSVRDSSSVLAPSSITPSYTTTNVPAIEIAVSSSPVALPHAPSINEITASGSLPIPSWCNSIDIITLGAGGGGGTAGFSTVGHGGQAGQWNYVAKVRGVDIPTGTTALNITIGAGGSGGNYIGSGGTGGTTSVAATGMTAVSASGGAGGAANSNSIYGRSPGSQLYNGRTYAGGGQQDTAEQPGIAPGGGASGTAIGGRDGKPGAPGRVWVVFRQ